MADSCGSAYETASSGIQLHLRNTPIAAFRVPRAEQRYPVQSDLGPGSNDPGAKDFWPFLVDINEARCTNHKR